MDEIHRMLGREHEADLYREARTRALAREAAIGNSIKGDVMKRKAHKRFLLHVRLIRSRWAAALAAIAALAGGGAAVASHVTQVEPSTVPTGFLAAHNAIDEVPVSAFRRAVKRGGADVFIQHVRLGANEPTGWHTHPGPALVTVVRGALTYEDAKRHRCRRVTYSAGQGFVDRGFGHVHRATAGSEGVDFYVVYVLPRGSTGHVIPTDSPAECSP